MGVPAETGERCQCHSDGRTRPALLPCRDLLSLGSLETESLHCRHNRPLPVDFNTHPWPAYRHVTDPSYPENLPKRAVGAALAPVLRRCVPLAGQARRLWSFARLKAQCPNLHASVVVLGTPAIHGTLDIALGRGLYLYPGQSVYVRVLDLDWIYPPGESDFCGGYALMRRDALQDVGGFDDTLIAGEEPEMCRRLRAKGYHILQVDVPMTTHDLAVTRFSACWRRAFRAGHAYAEVAHRFSHTADPLWSAELKRNLTHGSFLLGAAAASLVLSAIWPWFAALILGLAACAIGRSMRRAARKSPSRVTQLLYALHSHFQQIPILCGQLTWRLDARCGRRRGLIEYKGAPSA